MNIIENIKGKVRENKKKTIILTETDDRVLEAIEYILKEDLANIILLGKPSTNKYNLTNLKIVMPEESNLLNIFTNELYNLRKDKGLTIEEARKLLTTNYMYFACMLLKNNLADAIVSGAVNSSLDTFKPALQIIDKTSVIASSFMIMDIDGNRPYIFSDIALNINPTSEELSIISIDTSNSYKKIFNDIPKTSLLSYSSFSSGKGESVDKIKKAVQICNIKEPNLIIEGEVQADAALNPKTSNFKAPNSAIKGESNILIFPDLNSGNIGYKLVKEFTKGNSYGPFIQGLNKTISDLSRGCSSEEIIGTILITCLLAV